MEQSYSFEEIDRLINDLDLKAFEPGGPLHFTAADAAADPGGVLQKICVIYGGIRPILGALANFPLLPKQWRAAIKVFIGLMDSLCPGN